MSRTKLEVIVECFPKDYAHLEVRETLKHGGFVQKVARINVDLLEPTLRAALIKLGWTPPVETVKPQDIDKALADIAGNEPQAPMLAHLGEDKWMTGGVMSAAQITRLAALVRSVK